MSIQRLTKNFFLLFLEGLATSKITKVEFMKKTKLKLWKLVERKLAEKAH